MRKHYTTVSRKNCNHMSLCCKDIDYQRVSTFFGPLCIIISSIVNITITILDIIHRPVFNLKYNSTLYVCQCLTGSITSPLGAQQFNAIYSFVTWYINITITVLDIIHRLVFHLKLNSIGLSAPHRKHITSPLRAQQVNAIYRFVRIDILI
jgi:hypothetical protein